MGVGNKIGGTFSLLFPLQKSYIVTAVVLT
jgi:hypothetical protein